MIEEGNGHTIPIFAHRPEHCECRPPSCWRWEVQSSGIFEIAVVLIHKMMVVDGHDDLATHFQCVDEASIDRLEGSSFFGRSVLSLLVCALLAFAVFVVDAAVVVAAGDIHCRCSGIIIVTVYLIVHISFLWAKKITGTF